MRTFYASSSNASCWAGAGRADDAIFGVVGQRVSSVAGLMAAWAPELV